MSLLDDMAEKIRMSHDVMPTPGKADLLRRYDEQRQAREGWVEDEVWVAYCTCGDKHRGQGEDRVDAFEDHAGWCDCTPRAYRVKFNRPPVTPREPVECEGEVSGE